MPKDDKRDGGTVEFNFFFLRSHFFVFSILREQPIGPTSQAAISPNQLEPIPKNFWPLPNACSFSFPTTVARSLYL